MQRCVLQRSAVASPDNSNTRSNMTIQFSTDSLRQKRSDVFNALNDRAPQRSFLIKKRQS